MNYWWRVPWLIGLPQPLSAALKHQGALVLTWAYSPRPSRPVINYSKMHIPAAWSLKYSPRLWNNRPRWRTSLLRGEVRVCSIGTKVPSYQSLSSQQTPISRKRILWTNVTAASIWVGRAKNLHTQLSKMICIIRPRRSRPWLPLTNTQFTLASCTSHLATCLTHKLLTVEPCVSRPHFRSSMQLALTSRTLCLQVSGQIGVKIRTICEWRACWTTVAKSLLIAS